MEKKKTFSPQMTQAHDDKQLCAVNVERFNDSKYTMWL